MDKIKAKAAKAMRGRAAASKWLKCMLEGGDLYPRPVMAQKATALLKAAIQNEGASWVWEKTKGTLVNQVRRALKRQGWKEVAPWMWKHEQGEYLEIDLKEQQEQEGPGQDEEAKRKKKRRRS